MIIKTVQVGTSTEVVGEPPNAAVFGGYGPPILK
jgi:hypothetical protein